MNLQRELAPQHKSGLLLKNQVMTAAGTFGYGVENAIGLQTPGVRAVISNTPNKIYATLPSMQIVHSDCLYRLKAHERRNEGFCMRLA